MSNLFVLLLKNFSILRSIFVYTLSKVVYTIIISQFLIQLKLNLFAWIIQAPFIQTIRIFKIKISNIIKHYLIVTNLTINFGWLIEWIHSNIIKITANIKLKVWIKIIKY